jgi:SAM-dependent methyltransferase
VTSHPGPPGAVANTVQAARWNGDSGLHWVANRERNERRHRPLVTRLFAAAAVSAGERVLDVGCGCGATTIAMARAAGSPGDGDGTRGPAVPDGHCASTGGSALGLDLSGPMLEVARRRAADAGLPNIAFEHGDAQIYPLPAGHYDLAISSFGVMFFDDPAAAFANIAVAVRPGGRLAFLCWQGDEHNDLFAIPVRAFPPEVRPVIAAGSDLFGDPGRITGLLSAAGFTDIGVEPIREQVLMGTDVADVMGYARGMRLIASMAADLGDDARTEQALAAIADAYAARQREDGIWVDAGAWLVTARRS